MVSDTLILTDASQLDDVKKVVSRVRLPATTEVRVEPAQD